MLNCITTDRRALHDYLKESKEGILSGALKENLSEEGETKDEFTKRKKGERKKTLHEGKLQGQFVDKTRNISHEFSVAGTKNQIQSEQR